MVAGARLGWIERFTAALELHNIARAVSDGEELSSLTEARSGGSKLLGWGQCCELT